MSTPRHPLPVEMLVLEDARRLSVAMDRDARPWPASREEDLREMERQLQEDLAADPIHDHRPQSAPKHKVNNVMRILDQLARENSNRRIND